MKIFFTILLIISGSAFDLQANNTISDYFDKCRKIGNSDYATEMQIMKEFGNSDLVEILTPYYTDTVAFVRQQSYYLTYKKGLEQPDKAQSIVDCFVQKLNSEKDSGLRGTVIGYLQAFPVSAFEEEAKSVIATNLNNPNSPHFEDLVLLAGFIGTGNNELFQLSLTPNLSTLKKWNVSLALARLNSEDALKYCIDKVKKAPVNSGMVTYLLPDLIYTRKKEALDYCIELLYSDEKLCQTANPDMSESILCAYPIIELIAPVIVDFPIQVNPSIGLDTDDYEKLLQTVRTWLTENKEYKIKTGNF